MNDNQKVFEAVTGFAASYTPCGASQEYDETNKGEILAVVTATIENSDLLDLDINEYKVDVNLVADSIFSFHSCEGCANDLDIIFNSLQDS